MTASVSENFSEKKRGKTQGFVGRKVERAIRGHGGFQQRTRRGRLNEHYFLQGLSLFKGFDDCELVKRWSWLHYSTYGKGSGERWRRTIVSEIGRLGALELMEETADFVCERKPSAREAVEVIRRFRLYSQRRAAERALPCGAAS